MTIESCLLPLFPLTRERRGRDWNRVGLNSIDSSCVLLASNKEEAAFQSSRRSNSSRHFNVIYLFLPFFFVLYTLHHFSINHVGCWKIGKGERWAVSILTIRMKKLGGSWRKVVLVPQERLDPTNFEEWICRRGRITSIYRLPPEGVYLFFSTHLQPPFSRYIMFSRNVGSNEGVREAANFNPFSSSSSSPLSLSLSRERIF